MSELAGITPPIHVETAAFSIRDGTLKTLIAGANDRAPMPWSLGVPAGVIEMDPETGAMPQPHEVALRGVRSVIKGSPDVPVRVAQVGVKTIATEHIACIAFTALIPPVIVGSRHEHAPTAGVWINPDELLGAASPAKVVSHHYTLVEALQGLRQAAMNCWREEDLSPLTDLLAPEFTIRKLRYAATAVLGPSAGKVQTISDSRNFARKIRDLLSDTGRSTRQLEAGRPAALYTYQSPASSQWRRTSWTEGNKEKGRRGVQ